MPQSLTHPELSAIYPELDLIKDETMRRKVVEIWIEIAAEMLWDDLARVPNGVKAAINRTLVGHVRGVTQLAIAICDIAQSLHGLHTDRDLLVAACLLHDASKPIEYEPDPEKVAPPGDLPRGRVSPVGRNVQHSVYAAHKSLAKGLPLELTNLIITHTHASNIRTASWEAAVLFYADYADTDAGLTLAKNPLVSPRWLMGHG